MKSLHDFQQGYVTAFHWHTNPNGSQGGRIADSAKIPTGLFVDRSAIIQSGAMIEAGVIRIPPRCIIGKNAVIRAAATLKDFSTVGMGSYVGAGSLIGDYSVIGPDVEIGDQVVIGQCVAVHAGVDIDDNARIGDYAIIRERAFVGARCEIGRYASVGPDAALEDGARLGDERSLPAQVSLAPGERLIVCHGIEGARGPLSAAHDGQTIRWTFNGQSGLTTQALLQLDHTSEALAAFVAAVLASPSLTAKTRKSERAALPAAVLAQTETV
jgi:UDP-3-O-[3-hydroxymyristoyl] glucosamine N-acyltransferase